MCSKCNVNNINNVYQKCLNPFEKLDQFVGHQVQFCFRFRQKLCNYCFSFVYCSFNYEINDDNEICLMDSSHEDCKIYIKLNDIIEFKELGINNVYMNVIKLVGNDFWLDICLDN